MGTKYIQQFETKNGNKRKVYVPVNVTFDADGRMHPTGMLWEDGGLYRIERVKQIAQKAALKAGGQGDRYEVVIGGKISYLFYEHNPDPCSPLPGRWFIERTEPN